MDSVTENAGDFVTGFINTALIEQLALGVVSFAGELLSIVLGLVISLYILLDRERIARFLSGLSNALFKKTKVRLRVNRYTYQIHKTLFTFIASKGLDSIINIIVVTTILLIFDVPYAVLLGLMAGVLNFIPYLGSLIAVIIISLITVITGGFAQALQVVIPLFVFQQLDGNYIEPRIMKSSLKISPILVIIAVVVGGAYFGVLGMFLAVPIAVIIKQILLEYIHNAEHPEADEDHNELPPN
jgi:predicted PurR-regulated permease PerM